MKLENDKKAEPQTAMDKLNSPIQPGEIVAATAGARNGSKPLGIPFEMR